MYALNSRSIIKFLRALDSILDSGHGPVQQTPFFLFIIWLYQRLLGRFPSHIWLSPFELNLPMPSDGGATGDSCQYCLAGLKGGGSIHRYPSIHNSSHLLPCASPKFSVNHGQAALPKKKMAPRTSFSLFKFFFFAIILILCSGTRPI